MALARLFKVPSIIEHHSETESTSNLARGSAQSFVANAIAESCSSDYTATSRIIP